MTTAKLLNAHYNVSIKNCNVEEAGILLLFCSYRFVFSKMSHSVVNWQGFRGGRGGRGAKTMSQVSIPKFVSNLLVSAFAVCMVYFNACTHYKMHIKNRKGTWLSLDIMSIMFGFSSTTPLLSFLFMCVVDCSTCCLEFTGY